MELNFLNDCWDGDRFEKRTHCDSINALFSNEINCVSVPESKLKTKYLGTKNWDLHFPKKKIVIEYKTVTLTPISGSRAKMVGHNGGKNGRAFATNIRSRTEQAIGCACDLKAQDSEYKTGFLFIFIMDKNFNINVPSKTIDATILKFHKMVKDGLYDFFCPLITFGVDDHKELSKVYTFNKFLNDIKKVKSQDNSPLQEFFV